MTEIPEDIKRAAVTAHAGWVANLKAAYLPTVHEQRLFFLRRFEEAILAERERAAVTAEMHDHQGVIAAAIRKSPA